MEPTNNKSLFHFIMGKMKDLEEKKISVDEAKAYADLGNVAVKELNYELKRAITQVMLATTSIKIREIEGKNFDDTISQVSVVKSAIETTEITKSE